MLSVDACGLAVSTLARTRRTCPMSTTSEKRRIKIEYNGGAVRFFTCFLEDYVSWQLPPEEECQAKVTVQIEEKSSQDGEVWWGEVGGSGVRLDVDEPVCTLIGDRPLHIKLPRWVRNFSCVLVIVP
jgi:hypothetical protein